MLDVTEYLRWWFEYIAKTYEENPGHVFTEAICIFFILFLLFKPSYDMDKGQKLSAREEEQLIAEWEPEPLVSEDPDAGDANDEIIVESAPGPYVQVGGEQHLNLMSANYLGLANDEGIKSKCEAAIRKYGVGSCGPRGFYGTIDVHLNLENDITKFMDADASVIYSDSVATVASVIAAFAHKGDLLVCDRGMPYLMQQGTNLSRANTLYFNHNDMDDLERVLQDVQEQDARSPPAKLNRRFIVVEGLSTNFGDICNIKKVIELKEKYRFRLILDDSNAFGVLGRRGSIDHWGIQTKQVDMYVSAMDTAIASVGGFCCGTIEAAFHQRLSSQGYCFSASAPPYTAVAASESLKLMEKDGEERRERLRTNSRALHKALQKLNAVVSSSKDSPLVHIRLKPSKLSKKEERAILREAVRTLRAQKILVALSTYIPQDAKPPRPSIKLFVTSEHSQKDLQRVATALSQTGVFK